MTITVTPNNEQEKEELLAFLESRNYHYNMELDPAPAEPQSFTLPVGEPIPDDPINRERGGPMKIF